MIFYETSWIQGQVTHQFYQLFTAYYETSLDNFVSSEKIPDLSLPVTESLSLHNIIEEKI